MSTFKDKYLDLVFVLTGPSSRYMKVCLLRNTVLTPMDVDFGHIKCMIHIVNITVKGRTRRDINMQ